MKNKLSQKYKDDLYEKVLEKKRIRTIKRKKMLSIFIVFVSVVGFTTLGFSLLGQDDYNNFFISETENIMIEDEYQYFDDLGIKLEFINIDDNSLTLGINIKYEDIAEYEVNFEKLIIENNNSIVLSDSAFELNETQNISKKNDDFCYKNNSEMTYLINYKLIELEKISELKINIKNIFLNKYKIELDYKKEISIEE